MQRQGLYILEKVFSSIHQIKEAIAFLLFEKDVRIGSGVLTTRRKTRLYLKFVPSTNTFGVDIIQVFPEDGDYSFGWSPKA